MDREKVIGLLDVWVKDHEQEMVEELMNWVRHPSVSRADLCDESKKEPYGPDVRKMLDYALERAESFGFIAENHDGYCGSALYPARNAGDSKEEPEEIGFVAHLDVVPEGGGWLYSPYEPVLKDGFVIGRGADDNKAAGVIGLYLMRFLKENGISLKKTFRLMMGCAEETGMADFRHYIANGGKVPEFSIVADAGFPVCFAQKGGWNADILIPAGKDILDMEAGNVRNAIPDLCRIELGGIGVLEVKEALAGNEKIEVGGTDGRVTVTAHGKGGHAAGPWGTDNAIVILAKALTNSCLTEKLDLGGLSYIAEKFATPYGDGMGFAFKDEVSGELTSNIGVIRYQQGALKALLDIRYSVTAPIQEMTEKFKAASEKEGVVFLDIDIEAPFYLAKDDPKVKILMDAYKEVTGDEKEPYSMGGGTYSRVIPNAITFGPGLGGIPRPEFLPDGHGSCHGPDEVLYVESWLKSFKIYVLSVMKLGGAL